MTAPIAEQRIPAQIFPGVPLNPKKNSLNMIRLILASLVIVAHSFYTAGHGVGPEPGGQNLGGWAVAGFFVISGYLITGSRGSRRFGEYLTHRVARIFPGYVVNLIVTAVLFAPFSFYVANKSLSGFLTTPTTPLGYVYGNLGLRIGSWNVAGTPLNVPYAGAWNGSLWTLYYEFICYLIIGVLLCFVIVRKHQTIVIAALFIVSVLAHWGDGRVALLSGGNAELGLLMMLLPYFLGGALLFQFRKRLKYNVPGFIVSVLLSIAMIIWLPGWGGQLAAPLIGYALMWLAMTIPSPQIIRVHDISYGVYIYGFLVEQALAVAGLHQLGLPIYTVLSIVVTIPFAIVSWIVVERPAMMRARGERAYPWIRRRRGAVTESDSSRVVESVEGDGK